MPTPFDVPPSSLIERLAQYLKNNLEAIKPPQWALYVKTSVHTEKAPENIDWWYVRCASLLRKVYMKGPIGIERLRSEYGGRKDRGVRPEHTRKGSGAIVRNALKQLEEAGLLMTLKQRGRVVTPEGRRVLDLVSTEVKKELEKEVSELKKY